MTDAQQLRNLVSDFKVETGIEIFYQSGNGDLQNQVESDHGIQDVDFIIVRRVWGRSTRASTKGL